MGAGGDLSGLTTLLLAAPTCDFKCGLINQTAIESQFKRDVSINHASQRGAYSEALTNGKQRMGKKAQRKRLKWLTPCFQPSAGKCCRCVRR